MSALSVTATAVAVTGQLLSTAAAIVASSHAHATSAPCPMIAIPWTEAAAVSPAAVAVENTLADPTESSMLSAATSLAPAAHPHPQVILSFMPGPSPLYASPTESSILPAVSTPAAPPHPQVIISFMPGPSPPTPSTTMTEAPPALLPAESSIPASLSTPAPAPAALPRPHPEVIIPFMPGPDAATTSLSTASLHTITEVLTVTETLTVTVSASPFLWPFPPASPPSPPPSSSTPTPTPNLPVATWRAPAQMTDLTAFNVSKFGSGRHNLKIVHGVPRSAVDPALLLAQQQQQQSFHHVSPRASVLQLFYPEGSVNPAQRPVGGAQFYAAPLDLTGARNVSLSYKVFFPKDFEWVRAGKLPGLYGGHAGCSGGDEARDCFSTRLMWRKKGAGELYLYAPKDKQTASLCADPRSVCDAAYGFSIGRGSFAWAPGAWTEVRQTVTLNTPGRQDGSFALDVNGVRVIERSDVYYRGEPSRATHTIGTGKGHSRLGGLLGTLLSDLLRRAPETQRAAGAMPTEAGGYVDGVLGVTDPVYQAQREWVIQVAPTTTDDIQTTRVQPFTTSSVSTDFQQPATTPSPPPAAIPEITIEDEDPPVGFIGLFFSTFFGGHDWRYATPKDQYVWFKDFAMSYNS